MTSAEVYQLEELRNINKLVGNDAMGRELLLQLLKLEHQKVTEQTADKIVEIFKMKELGNLDKELKI